MNTWSLERAAKAYVASEAPQADGFTGDLIDALGEPDFGHRLITQINQLLPVDFFSVYQLEAKATPRMFLSSSRSGHDVSDDCFRSYQQRLHEHDHTFDGAKKTLQTGGVAMVYAHQTHFAPPHRAAIYARHGIQDRLSVVCRADNDLMLATNFYRFDCQPMFGAADADVIQSVARSVSACIGKHISIESRLRPVSVPDMNALAGQLAVRCPRLTARELDVCTGLLLGRTYDGIAADLGLSLATVKTYRARAYEKLGINFRSQLFSIASRLV